MKYQVEIKPTGKYRPLFAAESLDEIKTWLASNAGWRYSGTSGDYKQLQSKSGKDIAVTEPQTRVDDNGNVRTVHAETVALRTLTISAKGSDVFELLK